MRLDAPISDYMNKFPLIADPSHSIHTVLRMMKRYDVPLLPVLEEGKILGLVCAKEIDIAVKLHLDDTETYPIRDFIRKSPLEVGPQAPVIDVLKEMNRLRENCAIVTKHGKLAGIFTWLDVLSLLVQEERQPIAQNGR